MINIKTLLDNHQLNCKFVDLTTKLRKKIRDKKPQNTAMKQTKFTTELREFVSFILQNKNF